MSDFNTTFNQFIKDNPLIEKLNTLSLNSIRTFSRQISADQIADIMLTISTFVQNNGLENILPEDEELSAKKTAIKFLSNLFFNCLAVIPSDMTDAQGYILYPREIPQNIYNLLLKDTENELMQENLKKIRSALNKSLLLDIIVNAKLGNFLPVTGNSGSYSICMKKKNIENSWETTYLAIAKPKTEEPLAPDNPFWTQRLKRWFAQKFHINFTALKTQAGQGIHGEAAAYTTGLWVKENFKTEELNKKKLPSIVPYTCEIEKFKLPKRKKTSGKDKDYGFREVDVSLQLGVNLKDPFNENRITVSPDYIEAEKLFHISHHYEKKPIPPRFEKIKNFFRTLFGFPIEKSPWKINGQWIDPSKFENAYSILNTALSEQFYLMSVHNYLINDVDKHSGNWFIVGDYKKFIDLISKDKIQDAKQLASTFTISPIDNGASFAPTQQTRWNILQTRNRLQYDKLPVAQEKKLDKAHIELLWKKRKKFAKAIFNQYNDTDETHNMTNDRIYCALERLSALHQFVLQNEQYTIADMCQKIKYRDQIDHYAYSAARCNSLYNLIDTIRKEAQTPELKAHRESLESFRNKDLKGLQSYNKKITNTYDRSAQIIKEIGERLTLSEIQTLQSILSSDKPIVERTSPVLHQSVSRTDSTDSFKSCIDSESNSSELITMHKTASPTTI